MKIVDRFFSSFESSVESLRLNKVLLSNLKKEILEKSKEQLSIQKSYKKSREYFSKNQMGKSIIEKMDEKFRLQQSSFVEFSKSAEKKQTQLKNQSHKIYKSNPSLRVLQEYEDFIPAEKFTSILVNLVKGHQEGLVESQKLIDIRSYKRVDLEKGSVFVRDNRTHYSDVILINEENEVLFLVRNRLDDFQPKKYCFPGGHVEKGEDYKYAGIRELVEETGVSLSQDDVVDVGTYTDNKVVIHYFTAKVKKEELNIFLDEREHESYEWIPMTRVHEYPLILNLKENLEKVISIPVEFFINSEAQVRNFYYINGNFLKEEDSLLVKSLETIYTAFRVGEITQEQYEKQLKKSCREIQPFNLYKSSGETYYGVRISDKLEKELAKRIQRVEDFSKTDVIEKSEKIKGGLADKKTVEELAAHHKTLVKKIYDEIEIGKKVEMEHTDDPDEALEVTMDHLWEVPDYYTRLTKMEREAKRDELQKGKDIGKLIKKKVLVTRKNKTFLSTVYVSADAETEDIKDKVRIYDEPDSPAYVTRVDLPSVIVPGESYEFSTARGSYQGLVKSFLYDKTLDTIFILLQTPEGKIVNIGVKGIRDLKPLVDIPKIDIDERELPTEALRGKKFEDIFIVSTLGGSSDVKLGELDVDGRKFKFAIKKERETLGEHERREHLRTGAFTDSIYALMGQDSLPFFFMEDRRGRLYKLTKFMEGAKELRSFGEKERQDYYKKLQKGFVLDCLLSNWDVIGASEDNILVTPDKRVVRVDNDGSLNFRAKGREKELSEFLESNTVSEIDSFRDPSRNPSTAKVYRGITDDEIRKQVEDIIKNKETILNFVDYYMLSKAPAIRAALVSRMKNLEERFLKPKSEPRTPKPGMPSLVTEDYFENGWDELQFEGNDGIKEQIKKRILQIEEDNKDIYKRVAKNRDISVEELKRSLQELVVKFTEKSKPYIALHGENVLPLVFSKDGRFKSQFEVGTSCGALNLSLRSRNESIYFDFPDSPLREKELRPIYGYSTSDEQGINFYRSDGTPNPTIRPYGDVYCEVKREKALKSATITFGDSLNYYDNFAATPFAKPHFTSLNVHYLTKYLDSSPGFESGTHKSLTGADGYDYEELQYHNQLTLDDIKTINVTQNTMETGLKGMNKAVNKLLEFASSTGRFIPLKIF